MASDEECVFTITKLLNNETCSPQCSNSFIFKFDPILDINSIELNNNIDTFKFLIDKFVQLCFIKREEKTGNELKTIDKWMNAVLLYNSAYELASKEK